MAELLSLQPMLLLQTDTVSQELARWLAELIEGEEANLIRDIIAFFLTLIITYAIARFGIVRHIMRVMRRREFDPSIISLGRLVGTIMSAVLAFGLAFAIAGFGSFLTAMSAVSGALVIAVGLAANDLIANLLAGLYIINEKLFVVGDWIEWEDNRGRVEQIDLRITRVRTFDNELVAVPNSELANTVITNPVAYGKLRISVEFAVGFEHVDRAINVIMEEANSFPKILTEPTPSVIVYELGDTYVGLRARVWMDEPSRPHFNRLRGEFITKVVRRFTKEGITRDPEAVQLSGGIGIDGPGTVSLE
ncbi:MULTISPECIES: mechanosensitive ion channel family protein [Haloferax]|uniref:Mechanosensitive ion channel n=2 Tax=Haloferax TaxID=2251 RepID=A0A6G1Z650_9EURY|nr:MULTISPECIES: mechanosensitive ion channel family protein [Haloferax]KAB1185387.1 mechanosensitive ion channel family protein [Haloferax sp. CBA1149]MRW82030.1 mechanosensitive ion channel [Haloferax marinisediminis]